MTAAWKRHLEATRVILLETERLLFRNHEPRDLEPYCAMEADPEVRRYVGGKPRPRERAEERFHDVFLRSTPDRMALWATVYKPEGVYIGYCGIYPHFGEQGPVPGEGVLGFYLARPYWGRGLATEAGEAFIRFGWSELGLQRILAGVEIGNEASVRVLEKLGLRRVRTDHGRQRSFHAYELERPAP